MKGGDTEDIAILAIDEVQQQSTSHSSQVNHQRNSMEPQRTRTRCFKCNDIGHVIATCPNQKRCYFCNKEGHIKRNCILWERSNSRNLAPRGRGRYYGPTRPPFTSSPPTLFQQRRNETGQFRPRNSQQTYPNGGPNPLMRNPRNIQNERHSSQQPERVQENSLPTTSSSNMIPKN